MLESKCLTILSTSLLGPLALGSNHCRFAVNNTYGIKSINDTVYNYAKFAYNMVYGCRDQIDDCMSINQTFQSGSLAKNTWCAEANDFCRDNVEGLYYNYGNRVRGNYQV